MTPYTPVIFEHPTHGTLVVIDMVDIDAERTDDIDMAIQVLCPLPSGNLLAMDTSEGTLIRVKTLQ